MTTKKNILLLIEDNPLLTGMYKTAFEQNNIEVLFAHDGETGLQLAKEKNPDVILLDLLMPGIDGFTVLEKLKGDTATQHIKVIILTVIKDKRSEEKAKELGAIHYLIKSELRLSEIVERVLSVFE